jgi:hypothetical protein
MRSERLDRLLRGREIGRPRRDDGDAQRAPLRRRRLDANRPGDRVGPRLGEARPQGTLRRRVGARHEDVLVLVQEGPGDRDDLLRGLVLAEDDLRHSLAERAVQIHDGVAHLDEGRHRQLRLCRRDVDVSGCQTFEDRAFAHAALLVDGGREVERYE